MAVGVISSTQDFVRARFAEAFDEARPLAPVVKAILNTVIDETIANLGQGELRQGEDPNRFVLKLVLALLRDRYSDHVVTLAITLG